MVYKGCSRELLEAQLAAYSKAGLQEYSRHPRNFTSAIALSPEELALLKLTNEGPGWGA